jgi:cathepsin A (carboxypeptidase C)
MDVRARVPLYGGVSRLLECQAQNANVFYQSEFRSLNNTVWKNKYGKPVGEVRAAGSSGGKTSGTFTWLRVYEAGHMVPRDQPEVALEFFTK